MLLIPFLFLTLHYFKNSKKEVIELDIKNRESVIPLLLVHYFQLSLYVVSLGSNQ